MLTERETTAPAMSRRLAFFLLLLILLCETSSGQVEGVNDGAERIYLVNEIQSRKLMVEISLDYNDGKANDSHDPKKGKPGNGGRNP